MGSHHLHDSHSLSDDHCWLSNIIIIQEMCVTHKEEAESLTEGIGMDLLLLKNT